MVHNSLDRVFSTDATIRKESSLLKHGSVADGLDPSIVLEKIRDLIRVNLHKDHQLMPEVVVTD